MTHEELHSIPDFGSLFTDKRFVAAMTFMRQHPRPLGNRGSTDATAIIRSEGAWHSWFECLETLESLGNVPKTETSQPQRPKYQNPQQT